MLPLSMILNKVLFYIDFSFYISNIQRPSHALLTFSHISKNRVNYYALAEGLCHAHSENFCLKDKCICKAFDSGDAPIYCMLPDCK